MKKIFLTLIATVAIFGFTSAANAATLTFDDITSNDWIAGVPTGYGSTASFDGFDWGNIPNTQAMFDNVIVMNKTLSDYSSLQVAAVSGNYAAVNNYGTPLIITAVNPGQTFTFNNVYLTDINGWYSNDADKAKVNSQIATIEAFDSADTLVYQDNVTVYSDKATFYDGKDHFQNISKLEFFGTSTNNNNNVWMDNFSYNEAVNTAAVPSPEPASMVLGLMGLGSILGFRRKSA